MVRARRAIRLDSAFDSEARCSNKAAGSNANAGDGVGSAHTGESAMRSVESNMPVDDVHSTREVRVGCSAAKPQWVMYLSSFPRRWPSDALFGADRRSRWNKEKSEPQVR